MQQPPVISDDRRLLHFNYFVKLVELDVLF